MDLAWWFVAGVGHLGICAVAFNQAHATSFPRRWRKMSEKILGGITLVFGIYLIWQLISLATLRFWPVVQNNIANRIYLPLCLVSGLYFIARWFYRKWRYRRPAQVISRTVSKRDIQKELGKSLYHGAAARLFQSVPGNEAHMIASEQLTFRVADLPKDLEGLKICHLSDYHLTGQLDRSYFEQITNTANEFKPDLILITGDLIDEADCLDWIDEVFGSLSARHGVFYVLGNHDRRIKTEALLRERLDASGMVGVAGNWHTVQINGATIAITGNELPWYPHAAGLKRFEESSAGVAGNGANNDVLKILLSHSPDQFNWAQDYQFDLMLAGHTHGGQIQLPIIGPIVAPSKFGILYASGTFVIGKMLMHVSRGISGDKCIRINCPPEVGLITLTGDS